MSKNLEGHTVLVVGGSTGIGSAVAAAAADAGAQVVSFSRSGSAPQGVEGRAIDAADPDSVRRGIAGLEKIDHLVFTAWARQPSPPFGNMSEDLLRTAFDSKFFAAISVLQLAMPKLSETASITLTSGQVSRKYGVGSVLKGSVNAAVESAGRHLAKELAPRRVNVVSPGVTDTGQWGEEGSEKRRETLARIASGLPLGRVAEASDLADAYLFLMTNTFMTGEVLDINGGGLL